MRIILSLLILIIFSISGCSNSVEEASSKATGTITLDGQPVTVGTINFYPTGDGNSAFATINEDGTFTVNTSAGTVGLEPGDYNAVIAYEVSPTEDAEGNEVEGKNPIPERYRDEENPAIAVNVPEGGTDSLSIELTSD